ncbi:MAG: RsmB/NOP family class I SAM-dependent RNA methyltransferase [Chloroflexia bacterium]
MCPTHPEEKALALPEAFRERMAGLLGPEYPAFLEALGLPARQALRVNTLKVEPAQLLSLLELDLAPLPWCPEAFLLPAEVSLGRHPLHSAGLFYLQEPSATAAVPLLDPQPGEHVLDLCAAPGGKSTHIAARLQGKGLLWANEPHPARARILLENLERWGVRNAVVSVERPERLVERFEGFFDRVLVDAPCSGEGLFRRDPGAVREWSPEGIAGCARRQQHILEAAARLVRPGGVVVYATCTFSPEENEAVVGRFLAMHERWVLEEAPEWEGVSRGRPDWAGPLPPALAHTLSRAHRFWPHRTAGEGHFLARLRRPPGPGAKAPPLWRAEGPSWAWQAFESFCREVLCGPIETGQVALLGEALLALPEGMPDPAGLRLLRAGWLLGWVRRGRFVPSHALAMGLQAGAALRSLELGLGDEDVQAYLRGQSLRAPGPPGWLVVTVAGFPLGWGKRVGEQVKNHRPRLGL